MSYVGIIFVFYFNYSSIYIGFYWGLFISSYSCSPVIPNSVFFRSVLLLLPLYFWRSWITLILNYFIFFYYFQLFEGFVLSVHLIFVIIHVGMLLFFFWREQANLDWDSFSLPLSLPLSTSLSLFLCLLSLDLLLPISPSYFKAALPFGSQSRWSRHSLTMVKHCHCPSCRLAQPLGVEQQCFLHPRMFC